MLKLVGNFVRFSAIEVLCEATVFSEKVGLPKETLAQFVSAMIPGPSAGQLAMLHSGAYSDLTTVRQTNHLKQVFVLIYFIEYCAD